MSRATKILVMAVLALYVAELLFVPFAIRRSNGVSQWVGYNFIWQPPEVAGNGIAVLQWGYVFAELIATSFIAFLGLAGTRLRSSVSDARFPLLPVLVVYAIELFIVPFQVFWATGRSEFWGYGLILNPPELVNQGVVVARLDYIALEMMLTTLIIFIWYLISTRQGMSPR